MSTLILCKL